MGDIVENSVLGLYSHKELVFFLGIVLKIHWMIQAQFNSSWTR